MPAERIAARTSDSVTRSSRRAVGKKLPLSNSNVGSALTMPRNQGDRTASQVIKKLQADQHRKGEDTFG